MAKRRTGKTSTKKPTARARRGNTKPDDRVHHRLLRRAKKSAPIGSTKRHRDTLDVLAERVREQRMRDTDAERIAAEKADAKPKREKKPIAVACPQGDARLTILHRGRRGFTIVDGADPDQSYGAGPHGLPICPTHDVEMIAAEPIAVAEAFRQANAAADPTVQPALFDTSKPYNADGALVALDDLRKQIVAMREIVAGDQKQLAKHRKDLEVLEESLYTGLEEFMKRRNAKAERAAEIQERQQIRETAVCSFERHVGRDCPLCHAPSRALAVANLDATISAYTDITSEAHRAAAVRANSIDASRLTEAEPAVVAEALEIAGLYGLNAGDVETWTEEARFDALRWLEGDQTAPPPDALGMPHRAAAAGEESQACLDCGALLMQFGHGPARILYPEGALVGAHCTRTFTTAAPARETTAATA
jgi:hypothetical protein